MVDGRDDNGGEEGSETGPDELGAPAPLSEAQHPSTRRRPRTGEGRWRARAPRSWLWLLAVPVVLVALALAPTAVSGPDGPGDSIETRGLSPAGPDRLTPKRIKPAFP